MIPRKVTFLSLVIACTFARAALGESGTDQFVRAEGTHLTRGGQRYYYYGANCFYLPYFAQDTNVVLEGQSWRDMADEVLARCSAWDVRVIRVFAFNEENVPEFIAPYDDWRFQTSPGVYRPEALAGLDYVLNRASEQDLSVVLCLVNNWDAYGGMKWYVDNSPGTDKGIEGDEYHDQFYTDAQCRQWFKDHVTTLANRTNSINGRVYRDDPAVFAWQLANEPRCKSDTSGNTMKNWVYEMAAHIKSVDPNHMVSTGEEGWTAAQSWEGTQWLLNNVCPDVDYSVIHCWPEWWPDLWGTNEPARFVGAMAWVRDHLADAEHVLGKPFVLSEYGIRRPPEGPPLDAPYGRDAYHEGWFDIMYSSAAADGASAGMHFWMLEADNSGHGVLWGDGVFSTDTSSVAIIRRHAGEMNALISRFAAQMQVLGGNGQDIASGDAASSGKGTDFGGVPVGTFLTNTFAITNGGWSRLSISAVTTSGADAASFAIHGWPSAIATGAVETFSVVFSPWSPGTLAATLEFANNSTTTPYTVNLAGFGVYPVKPEVSLPWSANVTATRADVGGTIADTNGATVTERGIYWSLTDGFADGAGTKVSETGNFGTGVFSVAVGGLAPGRSHYFKAFASNSAGTDYSTQGGFLTPTEAPVALAATNVTAIGFCANWEAAFGAECCFLDVSEADDFSTCIPGHGNLSVGLVQTKEVSGLTPGTQYYYRLRAGNAAGTSTNSGTITAVAAAMWPDGWVVITNRRPTLYWAGVDGATWYRVWINRNGVKYDARWVPGVATWTADSDMKGGTYEWWVQPWNDITGSGPWSVKATFQVPVRVPGKTTLFSPFGAVATKNPEFVWQSVSDSSWYYLWVNRNGQPVDRTWVQGATNYNAANLPFGAYKWWVMTWSTDGNGPWSDPLEYSYGTPVLLGPSGAVAGTRRPQFTWISTTDTVLSRLWLNKGGMKYADHWVVGAKWAPSADLPYGTYEWWVSGRDLYQSSPWSTSVLFSIGMAVPVEPRGPQAARPVELRWDDTGSSDATWYQLWISRDGAEYWQRWVAEAETSDAGGGERTCTLPMVLPAGSYVWWIRTWNASGYGPWSSSMSFDLAP